MNGGPFAGPWRGGGGLGTELGLASRIIVVGCLLWAATHSKHNDQPFRTKHSILTHRRRPPSADDPRVPSPPS